MESRRVSMRIKERGERVETRLFSKCWATRWQEITWWITVRQERAQDRKLVN